MGAVVVNSILSGNARRELVDGEEYLVAPLTLIVPGVLNGSKGALYYPPSEIKRSVGKWEVPLTVYHPLANGEHVSAKYPGILEKQGIGFVRGDTAKPSLKAEGWFHTDRTRTLDPRIYDALTHNRPMEISTGLYTDNFKAPVGAVDPHGRPYEYVATNYKPDHVAVLPDQVGACSVNDGCGLNVNADGWKTLEGGQHVYISDGNMHVGGPPKGSSEGAASGKGAKGGSSPGKVDLGFKGGSSGNGPRIRMGGGRGGGQGDKSKHVALGHGEGKAGGAGGHGGKSGSSSDTEAQREEANRQLDQIQEDADAQKTTQNAERELVHNPFKSEAQRRACYAANDPNWDCDEWGEKTKSKLPEKVANTWSDVAREAALAARKASVKAKQFGNPASKAHAASDKADTASNRANESPSWESHQRANELHDKAALAHEKEATALKKRSGSDANRIAIDAHDKARQAHELAQHWHLEAASKFPTGNDANFASEQQRRYLWSQEPDIAEAWAHGQHTSDKDHKMPEETGKDVAGPEAKQARKDQKRTKKSKPTTNEEPPMSLWAKVGEAFGLVANAFHGPMSPAEHGGIMGSMGTARSATAATALDRGESVGELATDPRRTPKPDEDEEKPEEKEPTKNALGPGNWSIDSRKDHANSMSVKADKLTEQAEDNTSHRLAKLAHDNAAEAHWDAYKEASSPSATKSVPDYAQAGYHHQKASYHEGKAEEHAKQMGEEYGGEQFNQRVGNMYGMNDKHMASKEACNASLQSEHPEGMKHAMNALGYSKEKDSENAADSHLEAAREHEDMATKSRKDENDRMAGLHDNAAALHRKAASMHSASITHNKEFSSDEERKAAFAAMDSSGEKASAEASKASKSANRKGTADAHKAAASAHRAAAAQHEANGDKKLAKQHRAMAREHSSKAKTTNNQEVLNMTRDQMLAIVTNRCTCDKDRAAFNQLSDDALRLILNEPKAQGSNAGRSADGKTASRMDDKDYEEEGDYTGGGGEKLTDKNKLAAKEPEEAEDAFTGNAEFDRLYKQARDKDPIYQMGKKALQEKRASIINRLTANVSDPQRRQAAATRLAKMPTQQLEDMVELLPAPATNRNGNLQLPVNPDLGFYGAGPNYLGAAGVVGGSPAPVANDTSDDEDILPLPTLNYKELAEERKAGRA